MLHAVWSRGRENFTDAAAIREEVFIREQGFRREFDSADADALHLTLYEGPRAVATLRLLTGKAGVFHIGRVAVRRECRGRGLGSELMRRGLQKAAELGGTRVELGAQRQAVPFYKTLGFSPAGADYDDEGCPHQPMARALSPADGQPAAKEADPHGI